MGVSILIVRAENWQGLYVSEAAPSHMSLLFEHHHVQERLYNYIVGKTIRSLWSAEIRKDVQDEMLKLGRIPSEYQKLSTPDITHSFLENFQEYGFD